MASIKNSRIPFTSNPEKSFEKFDTFRQHTAGLAKAPVAYEGSPENKLY
jgi:hypothetical protein